jgi:carbon monoxide dehydrogenase subunit G
MIAIDKSQEARAPVESVWKIIADLDNEHRLWPFLKDVKILGRTENSIEREVKVRRGPMGEAKSVQTLVAHPVKRSTTLTMTRGSMLGTRKISLSKLSEDATRIDVNWEFEMKGVPGFAMGFVKDNIADVTEKALSQIAEEATRSVTAVN